jgi:hypothetical protein
VDRVVGFDGLGGIDDFETSSLEDRLISCGCVAIPEVKVDPRGDRTDAGSSKVRKGFASINRTDSDEDSDFD